MGVFINIESHIHKQPDPEQLYVGHTNIFVRVGIEPRHAAQQSITQRLHQPAVKVIHLRENTLRTEKVPLNKSIVPTLKM